MSRLPERVLGMVGFALMTIGWTGFFVTVPLSEIEGINNNAGGLSVVLVWLQGVVLLVMAGMLVLARRHAGPDALDAVRWPWPPLPTAVGAVLVIGITVVLGPLFALALLAVVGILDLVNSRRGSHPHAPGAAGPPWLHIVLLIVMLLAGVYSVVFGAPAIIAYSVELRVASAGLVQPAGVTSPPYPQLSLWGAFTVLTVCWAVLLLSYLVAWRRHRAEVGAVVA